MAGGVGSRFWPLSTEKHPKQFIDILGSGNTMLQETVKRFEGICPNENIFIVSNLVYENLIQEQLPFLTKDQILLEPVMRNTAPCIAYAVNKIRAKNNLANIVVSPADHVVNNVLAFRTSIIEALQFTAERNVLVTLGITPEYPATGYGYIKKFGNTEGNFFKVEAFKEKPEIKVAEAYVASGDYLWNSGIFVWKVDAIVDALEKFLPALQNSFSELKIDYYSEKEQTIINNIYPQCQNISIDYGIMEKAENVFVLPTNFGWSDLGTWRSLHELSEKDAHNNVLSGHVIALETSNSVIKISGNKRIIVQGLDDFIVAEYGDAILICRKDQEQRIKEFSGMLKNIEP